MSSAKHRIARPDAQAFVIIQAIFVFCLLITMSVKNKTPLTKVLSNITPGKILIPIVIGLSVIFYLLWKNFDLQEFYKLSWNSWTWCLLGIALLLYIVRHLAYSWRLRILSQKHFTWNKCIELIFVWEFASAVSPTSLGGSATALIFLAQEKLGAAKSVTIVLYSVVLDTLYFLLSFIVFVGFIGPTFIFPNLESIWSGSGYAISFWIVFFIMLGYGFFFYYGLFIDPKKISNVLKWLSKRKWLSKFQSELEQTSTDVLQASEKLKKESYRFHFLAFLSTSIAWILKFAIIPIIVFAVIQSTSLSWDNTILMLSRNQAMFAITAFSPTPGSSGVAEVVLGTYFTDFFSGTATTIIASIWRFLTYYTYLIIGMILVPIWIRKILVKRKAT